MLVKDTRTFILDPIIFLNRLPAGAGCKKAWFLKLIKRYDYELIRFRAFLEVTTVQGNPLGNLLVTMPDWTCNKGTSETVRILCLMIPAEPDFTIE